MPGPLRPSTQLLSAEFVGKITDEAFEVLSRIGVFVENEEALGLLGDHGALIDGHRAKISRSLTEKALRSAPREFDLFDAAGKVSFRIGGDTVHFDPGSAALRLFDLNSQIEREARTDDVIRFHALTERLANFHFQSTGLISGDVPQEIADCYRLYLGLVYCSKPIVTGTFRIEGFPPMAELLGVMRGGAAELRKKPLAIFDACPSPPLKWSNLTAQSVLDCARAGIPSEFVSMPLTGATSPVTLAGALVQHAAENLAGVVIAQIAQPGAPVIYGGSPAAFDMRAGTTPMGAIETMMIDVAYAQIGRSLGLPTHAYMGLSDSKSVDVQAGFETGMGALLAGLAGINVISGGGMLDYETCQSLEKLVIDNEIAGMVYQLLDGISQRDEPLALHLLEELADSPEFLTHDHTLRWHRREHRIPTLVDRSNYDRWVQEGRPTLGQRASRTLHNLLPDVIAPAVEPLLQGELSRVMLAYGKRHGLEALPGTDHSPL